MRMLTMSAIATTTFQRFSVLLLAAAVLFAMSVPAIAATPVDEQYDDPQETAVEDLDAEPVAEDDDTLGFLPVTGAELTGIVIAGLLLVGGGVALKRAVGSEPDLPGNGDAS